MQVNRIIPNQIMAKVQNFKNKNILSKFKTRAASQTVPVVAAPLVAYMAINSEKYKNNVIYKSSVDSVKREFEKRELPFKEDYVNIYSGTYSEKGRSVLNSYDDTKQKFLSDNLDFDNSLVDTSTGKPNLKGRSILRNMQKTKEELLENGVAIKDSHYNHKTGCLNSTGQNAIDAKDNELYFRGSTDDQHFESADTSYHGETYGDMPQIYEPETGIQGFPQPAGVTNFDDAISGTSVSEQLAEVADILDNPVLTGVVAELLPGTKFFKPAKDLFDGDIEKAA